MARITVLGGTGYTGGNIAREAAARGHEVTSFSRNEPGEPVPGVRYETGSMLDEAHRERAVAGADVVVAALAPRGELEDELSSVYAGLGELAAAFGARYGVVGGYSSLRPEKGAPRIAFTEEIPPQYAKEARVMATIADELVDDAPEELDWFFVSPAAVYGSYAPGEARGTYRIGGDIPLADEHGASAISGADFAAAIVDEIEKPTHRRTQFSVAY